MLATVMVFVFQLPVVAEYSQDRHAKKKAPLIKSARWDVNVEVLCLYRCWSSAGVIAFCAFSFGSVLRNDLIMPEINLFCSLLSICRGSGRWLSLKDATRCERALLTVLATSGLVCFRLLCSPL